MTYLPPVMNFEKWIAEHEDQLKPPVNNRQMWEPMGDFIVQIVGGPNQRTDYHLDPYEEWFYQHRGDMYVDLMTEDGPQRIEIKEGEMWMLPRLVHHSPQRPDPDSIGIVIERIREEGVLEKFVWFCLECHHQVHEVELQVRDIVADLPPVFEQFYASTEARTCGNCGALHPGKG
ncbi:3-hydroxyanthranilate 3,4-dioxygenase [Nocardioides sp.]|uniref:3-hydroxyanthranilate 3,4-dioxygenase n=1 Tax=Nocardioides sp. TaxID=35761 RepID=UPI0026397734|nr:3-hydroxyanthranilate 3,4-dioxygenase [Nocardioides sp.]